MNIKKLLFTLLFILSSFCFNISLAANDKWTYCAAERGVCNFNGTAYVRYGIDGVYSQGTYTDSVNCNNEVFGDPVYGYHKICEFQIIDNSVQNPPPSLLQKATPSSEEKPIGASGGEPSLPQKATPSSEGSSSNADNSSSQNGSYNANNNALSSTMCSAMRLVTGNAGKVFAAFAIISLGIGFFTGRVSWGLMIGVAMGIAAMFGAPTIVAVLAGQDSFDCGS